MKKAKLLNFTLKMVHPKKDCAGPHCPFHAPSKHHMAAWPMILRETTLVERQCEHGIGHPDPDSLAWFKKNKIKGYEVHGCDGCCQRKQA